MTLLYSYSHHKIIIIFVLLNKPHFEKKCLHCVVLTMLTDMPSVYEAELI